MIELHPPKDAAGSGSERLLRVEEIAEVLSVSPARVYELIRRGTLPAVRLGRTVRASRAALSRFIESGGRTQPSSACEV